MKIRMRLCQRYAEMIIGDIDIQWYESETFMRLLETRHFSKFEWDIIKIILERGCNGIIEFEYSESEYSKVY